LHGSGAFSSSLSALAAQVPDQPSAPTTTQVATAVKVAWTGPADNHLPISEYQVTIADSTGVFQEDKSLCDGSSSAVMTDMYCIIPMSSLTASPWALSAGTLIRFEVRARNARGWSSYSPANSGGVGAQSVPAAVAAPFTDASLTGEHLVYVEWAALSTMSGTGNSAVTSYHLQSGDGSSAWIDIIGWSPASLATAVSLTTSIVPGITYKFRVRAANIHGWGPWSTTTGIKAAQVPYQIATVSTSVEGSAGGVAIAWLTPADGSDPLAEYKIEIQGSTGSWVTESTYCVGAAVGTARSCAVPMSSLSTGSFGLAFDTLVAVRASARNSYGWGMPSPANTVGARTRRVPDQMPAPVAVGVSEAEIDLQWAALSGPQDGNSAVTSYNVYWDNGSGLVVVALLDRLVTSFSVTGLTGGVIYTFKVRARNIYGPGAFSSGLSVLASDKPDKMAIPTVTLAPAATSVVVAWTAPGYHSAPIAAYDIRLLTTGGAYIAASSCDGSQPTVVDSCQCAIPMAVITSLTGFTVDSLIQVKIRASNANGWGAYSELNTRGATIETVPA
jgi:hypothetical protein